MKEDIKIKTKEDVQHVVDNYKAYGNLLLMRLRSLSPNWDFTKFEFIKEPDGCFNGGKFVVYTSDGYHEAYSITSLKFDRIVNYDETDDASKYLFFTPDSWKLPQ